MTSHPITLENAWREPRGSRGIIDRVIRKLFPVGMILLTASPAVSQNQTHTCIVIQQLAADTPLVNRGECLTRLSPASTFKIPHALVALETRVVTSDSLEKWDGTKFARQPKWMRDHDVISALRPSVLWFFQRIAPRIGASRMAEWLATFEYGNRDVSGPITQYWVNGRLRISPIEQVAFLRRFYRKSLPVRLEHLEAVHAGLTQDRGTMENSLGIHPLEGNWKNAELNAKTGATSTSAYRVSWLVGMLSAGQQYVFAAAVWKQSGEVDTLDATRLAVRQFIESGLIPKG
jgi:beta-lactamase class D